MTDVPARLGAARRGSLGVRRVTVTVEWENGATDETVIGPASGVLSVAKRRAGTTGPVRYHWTIAVYDVPAEERKEEEQRSGGWTHLPQPVFLVRDGCRARMRRLVQGTRWAHPLRPRA